MIYKKNIHVIWGWTVSHVRTHLALTAPAYGNTARRIAEICEEDIPEMNTHLHLTKMANAWQGELETNDDIAKLVDEIVQDTKTKIIFFNPAMVDFHGGIVTPMGRRHIESGKYAPRLKSRESACHSMILSDERKVIEEIRKVRKDIFLVGFKASSGLSPDEQYIAWLNLLKWSSANLVLANDVQTRHNMIISPEEARYHEWEERDEILRQLVDMANLRSQLSFTRSTVVDWKNIPWNSSEVPENLREIVNYCIAKNAYKPFRGSTVGHFAFKIDENTFGTSVRKSNFNNIQENGLVKIVTDGPDTVLAYGSRPSVGGQSQRIIFREHPELDCIVHFHCPIKEWSQVPQVSQREYECGSHECGKNTSNGLGKFGNIQAVYLDNHGPNIVFSKDTPAQEVIDFIDKNFNLSQKTGGPVSLAA